MSDTAPINIPNDAVYVFFASPRSIGKWDDDALPEWFSEVEGGPRERYTGFMKLGLNGIDPVAQIEAYLKICHNDEAVVGFGRTKSPLTYCSQYDENIGCPADQIGFGDRERSVNNLPLDWLRKIRLGITFG
jgi:hypothetical protein